MAYPDNTSTVDDSAELEALFDSIVASRETAADFKLHTTEKLEEVQAMNDAVIVKSITQPAPAAASTNEDKVFHQLGQLARQLHDTLRELGYDKMLEKTVSQIPDARQRLAYIAQMTEQAASRVLNATDVAKPLQDEMLASCEALSVRWDKAFANELSVEEFKQHAEATRDYFRTAQDKHRATNHHLMEIMMAQDFQDLTGQVIKRVVDMAQEIETSLVNLLIEAIPPGYKWEKSESLLNGPVIDPVTGSDSMVSQGQVDDLLESLGF